MYHGSKAFTLIELSIVLVIIGLILGAVLIGQELVRGSQVIATVAQIYKYDSAVAIFQTKYKSLPGDFSQATTYLTSSDIRNGDDNGLIGITALAEVGSKNEGVWLDFRYSYEYTQFWSHLSFLDLVDGKYTGATGPYSAIKLGFNFPISKVNGSGGVFVYSDPRDNNNYYEIGYGGTGSIGLVQSFSPEDARNIDVKMDDGIPSSGRVLATGGGWGFAIKPSVSGSDVLDQTNTTGCVIAANMHLGSTATQYNTAAPTSSIQCALRIMFN